MHILHLTPYYPPAYEYGGVVRAVEGMAQALLQRQHTITVLTTDARPPSQKRRIVDSFSSHEVRDGVTVYRVRNV